MPSWSSARVEIEPLSGGLTNQSFLATVNAELYVVRIASSQSGELGIRRNDELRVWKAAAAIGIAPGILYHDDAGRVLVTQFVDGRHWSDSEIQDPHNLARLAQLLRAVHSLRVDGPLFDPVTLGCDFERHCPCHALPEKIRNDWSARVQAVVGYLGARVERRLCHNDLVRSNLIDDGARLWLIDWEYAAVGDPYYDLATIAHNNFLMDEQEIEFVQAYAGESQIIDLERLARMKVARDFYHVFWSAMRFSAAPKSEEFRRGCQFHAERLAKELLSFDENGSYHRPNPV
jgi:thiamine kinase-like enzyme